MRGCRAFDRGCRHAAGPPGFVARILDAGAETFATGAGEFVIDDLARTFGRIAIGGTGHGISSLPLFSLKSWRYAWIFRRNLNGIPTKAAQARSARDTNFPPVCQSWRFRQRSSASWVSRWLI